MKPILLLGGAPHQVPVIAKARNLGLHTIVCDNRPDNPGHRLAHRSYSNVSTTDVDEVLQIATAERVAGVLAYGSDAAALTAAIVADSLGLPGNPPDVIRTLTDKGNFRTLLEKSGLQEHQHLVIHPGCDLSDVASNVDYPAIVKPVDGSGSRGVERITQGTQLPDAVLHARSASRDGRVIVEGFIKRAGFQVCGDGFFQDGRLVFICFGDGHFEERPGQHAPFAETFPSTHASASLVRAQSLIERALQSCGFKNGAFNFDVLIKPDGTPFLIEIGPRNGGNFIPSVIKMHTGVDLTEASLLGAIDSKYRFEADVNHENFYASYMLRAHKHGRYKSIQLAPVLKPHVVQMNPYARPGDLVRPFLNAGDSLANLILHFDTHADMMSRIADLDSEYEVILEDI